MSKEIVDGEFKYGGIPIDEGHAWSTAQALHSDDLMDVMESIFEKLERAALILELFHPESSPGQFEFILSPLDPLLAVDALLGSFPSPLYLCSSQLRAPKHCLKTPGFSLRA